MNKVNNIDMANFLIEQRQEKWSEELELKTIKHVEQCDHMHDTWKNMMGKNDIQSNDDFPVTAHAKSVNKIQAGLNGQKNIALHVPSRKMIGNTKLEQDRVGIRNISYALKQNPLF